MRLVSIFLAMSGFVIAKDAPDWSRPRELPSLDVRWRMAVDACDVIATDSVVYTMSEDALVAHDAESGEVFWRQSEVGGRCLYGRGLMRAEGALFVGSMGGVYRVDESSGDVTEFVSLGYASDLYGPPLLVDVKDAALALGEVCSGDLPS